MLLSVTFLLNVCVGRLIWLKLINNSVFSKGTYLNFIFGILLFGCGLDDIDMVSLLCVLEYIYMISLQHAFEDIDMVSLLCAIDYIDMISRYSALLFRFLDAILGN